MIREFREFREFRVIVEYREIREIKEGARLGLVCDVVVIFLGNDI